MEDEKNAVFNQAFAYLLRIDEAIKHINYAIANNEPVLFFRALYVLYAELDSQMKKEEKETNKQRFVYIKSLEYLYYKNTKNFNFLVLFDWNLELRQIAENHHLLMPKRDDPNFAMGQGQY